MADWSILMYFKSRPKRLMCDYTSSRLGDLTGRFLWSLRKRTASSAAEIGRQMLPVIVEQLMHYATTLSSPNGDRTISTLLSRLAAHGRGLLDRKRPDTRATFGASPDPAGKALLT